MTCIVGLVHKDKVYLGGDSAGVSGWDIRVRTDKKVFKKGEFIFGFTSSFRMGQIIQFSFNPPDIDKEDIFEYMVADFIPELRRVLKEGGYARVESNEEKGGVFIVGVRGRLFGIESDFQVEETICGYMSCGCGSNYALGSLFTTDKFKDSLKPEWRLQQALEAATEFSIGVTAPFNFVEV